MTIRAERFQLALNEIRPSDWRLFERIASVFMADEYSNLRPVASMSGDGGADALLFLPEDDPTTLVQYSVRQDVDNKIDETCKRIIETFPDAKILIYVTNQEIGARSVKIRRSIRQKYNLHLDLRDIEWFITVRNSSSATIAEAEELAHKVVDPLATGSGDIIRNQGQALEDLEAKAAFVYLGLQWADDTREKGLTRLCFEAVVRSVLRETTSETRMPRAEVYRLVQHLLPGHHHRQLTEQVDGALNRLAKRYIRHWMKPDEFCLTWDERVRLSNRLEDLSNLDHALRQHLAAAIKTSLSESGEEIDGSDIERLVDASRSVIERVLLDRGEAFAVAVNRERDADIRTGDIEAVVDAVIARRGEALALPSYTLAAILQTLLVNPPGNIRTYLRGLADTYTLFAFMRETPDVQNAVVKIFADGDVWLDTSVILPLLAEELLPEVDRSHTELLSAAVECGLRLYITEGVLEEIVTHIKRCRTYVRASTNSGAVGGPPFLLNSHRLAGFGDDKFGSWLELFCGSDPESDLLDYFEDVHNVECQPLIDYVNSAELELRAAVSEVWHESRDAKDQRLAALGIPSIDPDTRNKLVSHDVENYLGIVIRREQRRERRSAFGYRSWWLTLDRTAFKVAKKLRENYRGRTPHSPAISPDFMLNYLAIGPVRQRLSKRNEQALPLMLNMSILDAVPSDLLDLAKELREELAELPPRIVRRKIKETLEAARRLLGPTANAGEVGLTDDVKARLVAFARER